MNNKISGQATVEYIFILMIAVLLGFEITQRFANFFKDSMGNVGHVLSTHTTVGVCPRACWFKGYQNGPQGP